MSKTIWAIVIIIIIVLVGWYIFYQKGTAPAAPAATTTTTQTNSTTAPANNVYMTAQDTAKGAYMADVAGRTLYTFDKDSTGTTTCYGQCAQTWPPYTASAAAQGTLPAGISVLTRADGTRQFAYNGKPLYYYSGDTGSNQLSGDGIGGVWYIVKM